MDIKELRKAWLKQHFRSWQYHEDLLMLHDEFLSKLHRHWDRPDIQSSHSDEAETMKTPIFLNMDRVSKPGQVTESEWGAKPTVGWADTISYNFNRGLDFANVDIYLGMTDDERAHLNNLVGLMLRRCTNIRRTVEDTWESNSSDTILDERYTGSIVWPTDWQQQFALRVRAGDPVPQPGLWQALDISNRELRVQAGETLPDLNSAYGITIWQHVGD